jgi:AcrR family transcriptional regulator
MTAETDWRARKKAATRRSIQEHAWRLFMENGYEATTVDEIAAAAGVSHMTFFRYFPQKEAVVEADDYDPLIAELIASRPADEPPIKAVHAALRAGLVEILPGDREALLARTQLIMRTPALRARLWMAQDATRDLFADALARRAGASAPDLALTVQAWTALAAAESAIAAWARGADGDLVALMDAAFAAIETGL